MKRSANVVLVFLALTPVLAPVFAQDVTRASSGGPRFDVVSIRRTPADQPGNLRMRPDGGITLSGFPVGSLVRMAYPTRGRVSNVIGLPDWANRDRYDVIATASLPKVAPDDVSAMMRAMLVDRFQLRVHTEKRELPVYDLLLLRTDGRLGPEMRPIEADCDAKLAADRAAAQAAIAAGTPPPTPGTDRNLPPPPCTLRVVGDRQRRVDRLEGEGPISSLVTLLRLPSGRYIVDKTGLKGSYRMRMEFSMRAPMSGLDAATTTDLDTGPTVFTAVREQLGLKLESSKAEGDVHVIDRLEPPTEN